MRSVEGSLLEEIVARAVLLLDPEKILFVGSVLVEGLPPYRVGFASDSPL
jgi:hypothetical protein